MATEQSVLDFSDGDGARTLTATVPPTGSNFMNFPLVVTSPAPDRHYKATQVHVPSPLFSVATRPARYSRRTDSADPTGVHWPTAAVSAGSPSSRSRTSRHYRTPSAGGR